MYALIKRIHQHRYFLLFILVFAYVQTIYLRITVRQLVNIYIFTPDGPVAHLLQALLLYYIIDLLLKRHQKQELLTTIELSKIFAASLLVHLLIIQALSFIIAWSFNNIERNFNPESLTISLLSQLLDGFIYGSFFLAYYYHLSIKKQQALKSSYLHALSERKIYHLKAQLNPHFLFNNLNVLDQLIDEDKRKASDFLNEFAEIYRYVLHTADKKLIAIKTELNFVRQYFHLFQYKYGNAYQLVVDQNVPEGSIAPLTLQLLLENALKHNHGTEKDPVVVTISFQNNIKVSNNLQLKKRPVTPSGLGLKNLVEQYHLLSKSPVEIHKDAATFTVAIPIIDHPEV